MGKKCSSQLHHVVVLVLLLFIFPCLRQSAPIFSVTGRRLMTIYFPNGAGVNAGSSKVGVIKSGRNP